MKRTDRLPIVLLLCAAAASLGAGVARAQGFETGKVIEKVACAADPSLSYALYLPPSFDAGKTWPVLFLFDPGARGPMGVGAFRAAADEFGWILVGSNDSQNGPMGPSLEAASAVWADARTRLSIDERRVYASGFSGGSRVASLFPRIVGRTIAGLIGCGAGLSQPIEAADLRAGAYVGLIGLADFNYEEMRGLNLALDAPGLAHRFLFFEGRHEWPDPAICARAVGWLEVRAMKSGLRPCEDALADAVIGRELDEARALEAAGRVYWAVERLEAARGLAEGLRDIPGLAARIEALRSSKEYASFARAERRRAERSAEFRREFSRAFGSVEDVATGGATAVGPVLAEMKIGLLKKEAKTGKTVEDRSFASRLLFEFGLAAQSRAADLHSQKQFLRAAAYFDLAIAACEEGLPREKYLYFNRACAAAASGDKKRALSFLATAVDKGLTDPQIIETDRDLDPIRDTPAYRAIIVRIKK